ncbi:MAG TPA: metallophosphoesterase [Planctomycetes bacterium]|nr:metallophosphoesterase [Planctomycetota bacterium]
MTDTRAPATPATAAPARRRMSRRAALAVAGCAAGGAATYACWNTLRLNVSRRRIALSRLPAAFEGLTVAFLADFHHSLCVPLSLIRDAAALAMSARPDLVLLGGDFITGRRRYAAPCIAALGGLAAPFGVFAVLGNHDHGAGERAVRAELARRGIRELFNAGVWLERGGARLRLGGVGDLWRATQDLPAALGDVRAGEGALVLTHNPDFAEEIESDGVDLLLAGHTHGGQAVLPLAGAPFTPSRYGEKYREGLARGPKCLVYVTRGVGTSALPVRIGCPPEVSVLELVRAPEN